MHIFLYLAIGFVLLYFVLLLRPTKAIGGRYGKFVGLCFILSALSMLVFIFLYKRSVWLVLIAVPLIYLAQIILQIISGAIVRRRIVGKD